MHKLTIEAFAVDQDGAEQPPIIQTYEYVSKWMAIDALMSIARGYIAAAPGIEDQDIYLYEGKFTLYNDNGGVRLMIEKV